MAKQNKKPTQVPASKPNQKRIDKLMELAKNSSEDDIQHKPHSASKNIDHIIKLNEELTAENSRLLEELEHAEKDFVDKSIQSANRLVRINELESELKKEIHNWAKEVDAKTDLQIELQSIKSKWWYKLMTCLNKN